LNTRIIIFRNLPLDTSIDPPIASSIASPVYPPIQNFEIQNAELDISELIPDYNNSFNDDSIHIENNNYIKKQHIEKKEFQILFSDVDPWEELDPHIHGKIKSKPYSRGEKIIIILRVFKKKKNDKDDNHKVEVKRGSYLNQPFEEEFKYIHKKELNRYFVTKYYHQYFEMLSMTF